MRLLETVLKAFEENHEAPASFLAASPTAGVVSSASLLFGRSFWLLRGASIPRFHLWALGKRTTRFWGKLHAKKHARTEYFPLSGKVYHVYGRKLYGQIQGEPSRQARTCI